MSYNPELRNKISTLNSVVLTSVATGTTWTGGIEDVSEYGRLGISIWSPFGESIPNPVNGTLTIEVSRDGVNFGGPDRDFANTAISESHMWNIVEKYYRLKYTHGTVSASTVEIQTQLSVNADTVLGHQLDGVLLDETEAIISRSIGVAQAPNSSYTNTKQDGLGFSTTALLTSGDTFDSGILSLVGYTQVQTDILSVGANGTTTIKFYEDLLGTNLLRTLTSPYVDGAGFKMLSAPAFTPYVRYQWTCTSTGQTQFYYDTKFTTKSISGQILGMEDFISAGMVANLGRNVIVGLKPDGLYTNIAADEDGDLQISSPQIADLGNTSFITTGSTAGHTTSTPFTGATFATRSRNIQENLIVIAAFSGDTALSDLGGTVTFRYYDDDGSGNTPKTTASITEILPVRAFSSVRNFGWLSNAGDYFRTEFVPDRNLVGDEFVAVTTTHSKLTGNDFKRLANQTLEAENQTIPITSTFLKGFDSNNDSQNLNVVETTNSTQTTYSLQVVSGARPSQLPGRTPVRVTSDVTSSTLMYSGLTGSEILYITDIILTVNNSNSTSYGRLNIRDGLSVTGTTILPVLIAESPTQETAVSIITHSFTEPLFFNNGVFFDIELGTLIVTGIFKGYKE